MSILELLLSLHETAVNAAKGHSIDSTSLWTAKDIHRQDGLASNWLDPFY